MTGVYKIMAENRAFVEYLKTRRSVTLPNLAAPGPNADQLKELLQIGARVPDHGKLAPWRFVIFEGEAREQAGDKLAEIFTKQNPEAKERAIEAERNQFLPAPLTIGVVCAAKEHPKIPIIEQQLAAGCACFNLVHGANALGFKAHWVTRWFAFNPEAAQALGAGEGEFFAGFVHVGTPTIEMEDRVRPDLDEIVSYWCG